MPQALLADAASRTFYEASRLQSLDQWWQWLVVIAVCAAVLVWSAVAYYYDSVEISRGLAILLFALRITAFIGILVFFMDIEKRTERKIVKNSRAVVMVDTSQSMALRDADASGVLSPTNRIAEIMSEFKNGDLLPKLREDHDVVVYRFDQNSQPTEIASFTKEIDPADAALDSTTEEGRAAALAGLRWFLVAAGVVFLLAFAAWLVHLVSRNVAQPAKQGAESQSWPLLVSGVLLIVCVVIAAVGSLRHAEVPLLAALGISDWKTPAEEAAEEDTNDEPLPAELDWNKLIATQGAETRLGEALQYVVSKERGGPIAGVVLLTDGGQNAGLEPAVALKMAQDARMPIHVIGIGSDRRAAGVRVVDVEAPTRVYPGDRFTISAYIQGRGFDGRTVDVSLFSREANLADTEGGEVFVDEIPLRLNNDGEVQPVKFEVEPAQVGKLDYLVRVENLKGDTNEKDNTLAVAVEIIDRQNKVMLIAGGPTREFRFLRNQLFRDRESEVHVLLQTALPGISQEADEVLQDFPVNEEELFEYDCIVAFDPDWLELDELQIDMLERWVSEKAGGLVVVAGPVYTPRWSMQRRGDSRVDRIKALYPVSFFFRGSAMLSMGRFGGDAAWPPQFTRDGLEAEFLWLEDDAVDSEATWNEFEGMYGYFAAKDAKPGAKIYARFSDPDTAIDDTLPIYMAGHFYGAGRVFFQASGEMWRLRAIDDSYFETYYTKLIRHVSQGRLLRDSARGVLLVEQDRCFIGDQVAVRARLTDAQFRPLTQDNVSATLSPPGESGKEFVMTRIQDGSTEGMYAAQFTAEDEGTYRIELPVPQADDLAMLTREVRVRVPEREIEQPQRNDSLLNEIAMKTEGTYYIGVDAAMSGSGLPPINTQIAPQDQETFLPGAPDKPFEQLLMTWLLALICGALCLEWLLRRLSKLA